MQPIQAAACNRSPQTNHQRRRQTHPRSHHTIVASTAWQCDALYTYIHIYIYTYLNLALLQAVDAYPRPRLLHQNVCRGRHPPLRPEVDVLQVYGLRSAAVQHFSAATCVMFLQIKPFFLPVDIQHNQASVPMLRPYIEEIQQALWSQKPYATETAHCYMQYMQYICTQSRY